MKQALFSGGIHEVTIHTDGGSRGNPGPAAIGVVVKYGGVKKEYGETLGNQTNNVAEYQAVVFALKKTKQHIGKANSKNATVKLYADSELLLKKLKGEYKVEEESLQMFWMQIWNLRLDYKKVEFHHVFREKNKEADRMVNRALDGRLS